MCVYVCLCLGMSKASVRKNLRTYDLCQNVWILNEMGFGFYL